MTEHIEHRGICTIKPASRKPTNRFTWTLDYCANLVMGQFILRAIHNRLFEGGVIPFGLTVGRSYPVTIIPVRAVYWPDPEGRNEEVGDGGIGAGGERDVFEACRFHVGRFVLLRGKRTVMFCSVRKHGGLPTMAICLSFVYRGGQSDKSWRSKLKKGKLYHAGAYETPAIYEAILGSRKQYCGQPI